MAAGLTREGDLRQLAQPVLAGLAEATGTTAFLGIVYDDAAPCIGRVVRLIGVCSDRLTAAGSWRSRNIPRGGDVAARRQPPKVRIPLPARR